MSTCELSPTGHAFSTMLAAFVGSILNGLFNGFFVAFITGWICWFSPLRIILAAVYEYWLAFKLGRDFESVERGQYETIEMETKPHDPEQPPSYTTTGDAPTHGQYSNAAYEGPAVTVPPPAHQASVKKRWAISKALKRDVTTFGWLGWCWSAIYTPISQTIWVATNARSDIGGIMLVRAVAIGVSALSLTFDTKQRYGASLGRRWGSWAFIAFNIWNATACLLLGLEAATIGIIGALQLEFVQTFPALLAIYPVFLCIWAFASFKLIPPVDASRPGFNIVADVLMGAFAGLAVAFAAFAYYQNASFDEQYGGGASSSSGLGLGQYLSCESASFWDKFAAVAP